MTHTDEDFDALIAQRRTEAGLPPTTAAPGEVVETPTGFATPTPLQRIAEAVATDNGMEPDTGDCVECGDPAQPVEVWVRKRRVSVVLCERCERHHADGGRVRALEDA